jgi:hypothetical protein
MARPPSVRRCRVGGEVSNSVITATATKATTASSATASWANGATWVPIPTPATSRTPTATYRSGALVQKGMVDTGVQFCGLLMGDHRKSGINTMFNTGTVVGVAANVFGGGFPPKHIPGSRMGRCRWIRDIRHRARLATAQRVMERRQIPHDGLGRSPAAPRFRGGTSGC